MTGAKVLAIRMIWAAHDIPVIPLRLPTRVNDVIVSPEPGHPFGRKGQQLEAAWTQAVEADTAGLLIIDGDVIVDIYDLAVMFAHIDTDPTMVWTAPTKIWPKATGRSAWTWDCWTGYECSQDWPADIDYFSFGFTYLPRRLIEFARKAGLRGWRWPTVDSKMAKAARDNGVGMRVVNGATPKHLNW